MSISAYFPKVWRLDNLVVKSLTSYTVLVKSYLVAVLCNSSCVRLCVTISISDNSSPSLCNCIYQCMHFYLVTCYLEVDFAVCNGDQCFLFFQWFLLSVRFIASVLYVQSS